MSKVLVVTDYSGVLHITPLGNKPYYERQNNKNKSRAFLFREMEEKEAIDFVAKNKGTDPDYVRPQDLQKVLNNKDSEIESLKAKLAALEASSAQPPSANELVTKINASDSVDEIKKLAEGDTRKTVIDAAEKRITALNNK
ncbi:MAG TPA: hypothetical protein PL045_06225 [Chitinophagaceae bacterium]|nr:hypothetical protein [Chitinophagaceae bacterium]